MSEEEIKDAPESDQDSAGGDDEKLNDQQTRSWLGRIQKEQKDFQQTVIEELKALKAAREQQQPSIRIEQQKGLFGVDDTQSSELNARIRQMHENGDFIGAQMLVDSIRKTSETQLSRFKQQKLDVAMKTLPADESPHFQGITDRIREQAQTLVNHGYDPEAAVIIAEKDQKNRVLQDMFLQLNQTNPGALKMLSGGGQKKQEQPSGKLPKALREQCERDVSRGVFKDEKEFLQYLSPQVKAAYGIG